jgi:protein transport protein SEC20
MPSTFPSLQARLDALQETHKATLQLINRLASLKLQPGSLPANTTTPDARSELTAEIHDRLKREDEQLEIASQEVQDSTVSDLSASAHRDGERDRVQALLAIQVAKLREDFNQYVLMYREMRARA